MLLNVGVGRRQRYERPAARKRLARLCICMFNLPRLSKPPSAAASEIFDRAIQTNNYTPHIPFTQGLIAQFYIYIYHHVGRKKAGFRIFQPYNPARREKTKIEQRPEIQCCYVAIWSEWHARTSCMYKTFFASSYC